MRSMIAALLACCTIAGAVACGSSSGGCPGITCTNCSASGDCNITCGAGQVEVCESLANFGGSASLRCAHCR